MTYKKILLNYALIVLYTVGPILSVLLASGIAHALGGKLNEGNVQPVFLLGINIGKILTTMFVAGWLIFLTIPTGLLAFVVFTIWWIAEKIR